MLRAVQRTGRHAGHRRLRGVGTPAGCPATLSLYPAFGGLLDRVHEALDKDAAWGFGMPHRQFWAEAFLLHHFQTHRCRVPHTHRANASASRRVPHFYVVPVLWRSISLLTDKRLKADLFRRAVKLVQEHVLSSGSPFHSAPEMHVLLHTSTAKPMERVTSATGVTK